jgi:hypothetical protein
MRARRDCGNRVDAARAAQLRQCRVGCSVVALTLVLGCGDGIGRPLLIDDAATPGAAGAEGSDAPDASPPNSGGLPFGGGVSPEADVPSSEYCDAAADWPQASRSAEQFLLDALNTARAIGALCAAAPDSEAPPLVMQPALRCAARLHARDMALRNYVSHENPEGEGPEVRIARAGHTFGVVGEAIAEGALVPLGNVEPFALSSDEDCRS